jgi:alkylhydroperoxidase family enzyme
MPWIDWIDEKEAEGRLAESYDRFTDRSTGKMDHILKIHSLNPPTLDSHYTYYRDLMFGRSGLSRTQREMIAVVVSTANRCEY